MKERNIPMPQAIMMIIWNALAGIGVGCVLRHLFK